MYIQTQTISIKVQFGQAALQMTSISPSFFPLHIHPNTQTLILLWIFYKVTKQKKKKRNDHLCATENISALGLN